jgi:pyruvate formate lyase activating enzyme
VHPLVFDIRRFALDDGPGIRTTVFLKGCPLACLWCHNPESIRPEAEIVFHRQLCLGCGECATACPRGALCPEGPDRIDRRLCAACGACAEACPATALRVVGSHFPPSELLRLLLRDRSFFETSGGGVTFSGGEPALHPDYLSQVLTGLKHQGISTAIQTCGLFDYAAFRERILPLVDLIFFDLKLADPGRHRRYTGRDNAVILSNFRRLAAEARHRLRPRVPLVPGITATPENLAQIAAQLKELGFSACELLSCHSGGIAKRRALGESASPLLPGGMLIAAQELQLRQFMQRRLAR